MSDETIRWLIGVIGAPTIALLSWMVMSINRLKNELDAHKLHVSEEYARTDTTEKIFQKLDELSRVVYEIAGTLKIPVKRD